VARAAWLALALLLSAPACQSAWTLLTSSAFLVEFLSGGRLRPLSAITPPPAVRPLGAAAAGRPFPADLYVCPWLRRPPGLVLAHGIAPDGKDDPQLASAAALLARAGWAVAVPTIAGLTALRLRPDDAAYVAGAAEALEREGYRPVALLGVSLGAAPVLSAAAGPGLAPRLSAVLALGGYASARELLRYTLTGAYGYEGRHGRRPVDEGAIATFARANGELLDGAGRALVDNRDPSRVDALVAALPDPTRRLLDALSPERSLGALRAPLFLIHGRGDPTVPFTESLRLDRAARAAGRPVRTAIVGALGHVDPDRRGSAADLARAWARFYAFRVTAAGPWP
jgi:fermentation-respiration switch protein FrsA (DUF1100 family)